MLDLGEGAGGGEGRGREGGVGISDLKPGAEGGG